MIRDRIKSFSYAFKGIAELFRGTPNARIHLLFTIAVIICGFIFQVSQLEWCILALSIGVVLGAEAFNSALENLVDLVSPDYHELAGKAKDLAAAGVLFCAIGAAIAGTIIFLPKGLALMQ